jgi:hypothetical protein
MRLKLTPVALFALSVVFGSFWTAGAPANAWAKGGKGNSEKTAATDSFNRQFEWEKGVVGNNDKKLDRDKIAAMQAAARREDAAHKNEPAKKTERPSGVGVPASSTLPTMDIEKPAPVAARPKQPRAAAEPAPKSHDSLDQLLDSEKETPASHPKRRGDGGLGSVLAVGDSSPAPVAHASAAHENTPAKTKGKHPHRR